MKYSICFFPFVGVVIGGLLIGWHFLANFLQINRLVFAALAAALPTLVTGGFHMDGFCDTVDALSSYRPMERKLEILKDSNVGAFAVLKCVLFYLGYFALFTQLNLDGIYVVASGYVLSRVLSGFSIVWFKSANGSGLAAAFQNAAHKRNVSVALAAILVAAVLAMLLVQPVLGGIAVVCALVTLLSYRVMAYRQFGGITGDLAGYFLTLCEFFMLAGVFFGERILTLWS